MEKRFLVTFEEIIACENLLAAWEEFIPGKRKKLDVQAFARNLGDEVVTLHEELTNGTYRHGPYQAFIVNDPKRRQIHKASVRDRLLHHALHRKLYPYFAARFISDSYSCQLGKGTHRAMERFRMMSCEVSGNHSRTCWVLKCDIRKFFASIDHEILIDLLNQHIVDARLIFLLKNIVSSFAVGPGKGIPLGNLTSQLFSNVYLHTFDLFMKLTLGVKFYVRYADDFVLLSDSKLNLFELEMKVRDFLRDALILELHPDKVSLSTVASGIDFLGWIQFPHHRVLRTKTKHRILAKFKTGFQPTVLQSYLGLLGHGDAHGFSVMLDNRYWLKYGFRDQALEEIDAWG